MQQKGTPRKCSSLPCGQLDFESAVTTRNDQFKAVFIARIHAALSRAALVRDGHADLRFTMTVWIGLVTARNNHFVGNLLLELRPKSLEKKTQSHNILAIRDQEMKMWNRFSGKLSIYPGQYISIATRGRTMNIGGIAI